MNIERLCQLFDVIVSELEEELKSYASLFCAERGYCIDDSIMVVDDEGLLPEIHVALTPALRYELPQLAHLAAELENDLNNIVFSYAYNTRYGIGAEGPKTIDQIPHVSERVWRLMTASQN